MDNDDDSAGTRVAAPPARESAGQAPPGPAAPRPALWPVLAMLGVAVALVLFYLYSQGHRITFGYFAHPPIYGRWNPVVDQLALYSVPAGLLLAGLGWLAVSTRRIPTWAALAMLVAGGVVTAAAIAVVRGDWQHLIRGVSTTGKSPYYSEDLHFVYEYGVRGFTERFVELRDQFHSYNSKTHPAGVHLFLYVFFEAFGDAHRLRITTALAVFSLGAAVSAWAIGRELGGPRAGRIAAALFVAAPGPLLLAYTSMDAVFAVILSAGTALLLIAARRRSAVAAAAGGAVLGLGTLMTFATVFVVLAATVTLVVVAWRRPKELATLLGAAAAGGLVVLLAAQLLLGFDLWGTYDALLRPRRAYDPYWIFGSPAAFLMWAGLPLAALGVPGLFDKVRREPWRLLPLLLVLIMVFWATLPSYVTKLRPGEVERTWAFLYPLLAAAAGLVVDRWTRPRPARADTPAADHTPARADGPARADTAAAEPTANTAGAAGAAGAGDGVAVRWSGAIIAGLILISVAQTVFLQALWDNLT